MFKDGKLSFKEDSHIEQIKVKKSAAWKILIVDDEPAIHEVTKLALNGFTFEERECEFISAYSASEAKKILQKEHNIALALVDVVMETDDAGLNLVDYIRKEMQNKLIRIILRTGQPGQAPEEKVIIDYDINDYKSKSELTTQKLFTAVFTCLRAYRDMVALERNRQGLKKIIASTSSIEKMSSLEIFLSAVLEQLSALMHLGDYNIDNEIPSFIAAVDERNCIHIAGSSAYNHLSKDTMYDEATEEIQSLVQEAMHHSKEIYRDGHYILFRPSKLEYSGFVLYMNLERHLDEMDNDLIKLFIENAKIAYENTTLSQELDDSQREIIFTISEIVEQRSNEAGHHVKRVALYSKLLAKAYGLPQNDIDTIFVAAPMHDIGKVAIPDSVLKKPGKLDDEEMIIMRDHARIGYEVLRSSKRNSLKMSAVIANEHHEKWDGTGYPRGLKGEDIHIYARIVALADVFDALGSPRVYKEKWDVERILKLIKEEKGKHFDPTLVDLFFKNIDKVMDIYNRYKDD